MGKLTLSCCEGDPVGIGQVCGRRTQDHPPAT
jgi:hypothetical protein